VVLQRSATILPPVNLQKLAPRGQSARHDFQTVFKTISFAYSYPNAPEEFRAPCVRQDQG